MGQKQRQEEPCKRFACDRCHAQKLRCLRNDTFDAEGVPCVRCERAKVECIYSPSDRLGRPPEKSRLKSPRAPRSPNRKRQRCEVGTAIDDAGTGFPFLDGTTHLDQSLWTKRLKGQTEQALQTEVLEVANNVHLTARRDPQSTPEIELTLDDTLIPETDSSHDIQFDNCMLDYDWEHDIFGFSTLGSSALETHMPPLGLVAADRQHATAPVVESSQVQDVSISNSTMHHGARTAQIENPNSFTHALTSDASLQPLHSALVDNSRGSHVGDNPGLATPSCDAKEQCMARLSNMVLRLCKQLDIMSSDTLVELLPSSSANQEPAHSSAAFNAGKYRTSPIEEALSISQELIQMLDFLKLISTRSTTVAPHDSYFGSQIFALSNAGEIRHRLPRNHDSQYPFRQRDSESSSRRYSSNPASSYSSNSSKTPVHPVQSLEVMTKEKPSPSSCSRSVPSPYPRSRTKPSSEPSPSSNSPNPLQLDIPMMLLILTCYIRLIRIYNAFFTRCVKILLEHPSAAHQDLLPGILPSFELGGFKPSNCANLQMSIMVEASLYMTSRMEQYLAPRRTESVGQPGYGQKGNADTQEPVVQLMDLVMKEEELGFLGGDGGSKQLKENIEIIKLLIN